MRSKEEAHDYRYFPDPDLPPLVIEDALVEEGSAGGMPALPAELRKRWTEELSAFTLAATAHTLTQHPEYVRFFGETIALFLMP